jgi:hypothetical protein
MTKRPANPPTAQKIAAHARQHRVCEDCGAAPGAPCIRPGRGRSVHKSRFVAAATALKRQEKAPRTLEQAEILAGLPKIPKSAFAAITTERGGLRATREWFLAHGIYYPPPPAWRKAAEMEDE